MQQLTLDDAPLIALMARAERLGWAMQAHVDGTSYGFRHQDGRIGVAHGLDEADALIACWERGEHWMRAVARDDRGRWHRWAPQEVAHA